MIYKNMKISVEKEKSTKNNPSKNPLNLANSLSRVALSNKLNLTLYL